MISDSATTFPVDVKVVTNSIRKAFADVLSSAGADPLDRRSIEERTGLSETLSWKLSKIIATEDTAVVLKQMPRGAGIKKFLDRAGRAGAKSNTLAAAKRAIAEYERLIETHSGDRETLDLLGSAVSPAGRRQQDEQHRKLAFQGMSSIWGAQARAVLKIQMMGPGSRPGLVHVLSTDAIVGFRRLRPGVPWVIASRRTTTRDGSNVMDYPEEALDPKHGQPDSPPIIEDFCSQPVPTIRLAADDDPYGHVFESPPSGSKILTFELVEGPIGNTGVLTCVVGTVARDLCGLASPGNERAVYIANNGTPTECLIVDTLVHDSILRGNIPSASLHGQLQVGRPFLSKRTQLPLSEPLQDVGRTTAMPPTPEFKDHDALLAWIFDRFNWSPAEFKMFRVRIPYPVCPSALVIAYDLPPD